MPRTSMAKHARLPPEVWSLIFAFMKAKGCRSAAATCRYFRTWRTLAWAEISLWSKLDIQQLAEKMKQIATIFKTDSSFQQSYRSISMSPSQPDFDRNSNDMVRAHDELNVAIAHVLQLAPNLNSFVFSVINGNHYECDLNLEALCELPALKRLVLNCVHMSYDDGTPLQFHPKSHVLQHFVVDKWVGLDVSAYLGVQKLLEKYHW
jgi:hypothetical protein